MILQELLRNNINRKKKVVPFFQSFFPSSKSLNRGSLPNKAKGAPYETINELPEQTGTRTIAYARLLSEEKSTIGNITLTVLASKYAVGIGKTYFHDDNISAIFRTSFSSRRHAWATGYIFEKYLFFSYLRLMRRENIWANSLFLVKKPFYVPIREEVSNNGTYKE